eukprot:symbB.v1.2.038427.t1/scaffold5960.1/size22144/1
MLRQLPKEHWQRNYPNPLTKEELESGKVWTENEEIIFDALWADPHHGLGSKRSERGKVAVMFGEDITQKFLEDANLSLCLRSHRVPQSGLGGWPILVAPAVMPRKPRSGLSKASSRRPDGENETELLHVDEDVLGIGFKRTRPEFFNPMWQLSHPRSSEGDLDGADGQDLDFPPSTGVSLHRVDPSEVAASLMKKAGFRLADDKDVAEEKKEEEEEEEQVDLKDPGELPSLHLEVPDSPEAPSATPSPTPFAPVPE